MSTHGGHQRVCDTSTAEEEDEEEGEGRASEEYVLNEK